MRGEGGVFTGSGQDRSGTEHCQNGIEGRESAGIADFERDDRGLGYSSHGSKRPLRQFLSLSEDGYLLADGISGGEIPTTKGPPESIESLSGMPVVSGITWKSGVGGHLAAIAIGAHRPRDQRSSYSIRSSARVGNSKASPARSVPECCMN